MKLFYLVTSFVAVSIFGISQQKSIIVNLKPAEFISKINLTQNKQLLDVRTAQECNQGKINSAVNIDVNNQEFESKIKTLNKDKPVFVYCAAGIRSAKAASILEQKGFKIIYNCTSGGYTDLAKEKLQ